MVHRVRKSVSSVVRLIVGRVIVPKWMMVPQNRRSDILEPTPVVREPAAILTVLVMKSVDISRVTLRITLATRFMWIPSVVLRFLLSKTTMSVKLMLHFWWNLKVSVFGFLVALRVLRLCSPRVMKMIHAFQMLIRLVVDRSILEMVLRQRLHPCPDSQFEMMLLVTSGSLCILYFDQPKPTPLMRGTDFLEEQRCVINYGVDLIQFPMQSDCWWPLFVSWRPHSMPLCG